MLTLKKGMTKEQLENLGFVVHTNLSNSHLKKQTNKDMNEIIQSIVYYLPIENNKEGLTVFDKYTEYGYPLLTIDPLNRIVHVPTEIFKYETEFLDLLFKLINAGVIEHNLNLVENNSLLFELQPINKIMLEELPNYLEAFLKKYQMTYRENSFMYCYMCKMFYQKLMEIPNISELNQNIYLNRIKESDIRSDIVICMIGNRRDERTFFDSDETYKKITECLIESNYTLIDPKGFYEIEINNTTVKFMYLFISL